MAVAVMSIGATVAVATSTYGQANPTAQRGRTERTEVAAGAEVLARGPVHEAFAEPVVFDPEPSTVVDRQPPDPIEEQPPDQRPAGDNVAWMPGYWSWDHERDDFIWVSGFWRVLPPGRQWMPGYWAEVSGGVPVGLWLLGARGGSAGRVSASTA
jgi:hypothetical protein